MRILNKESFLPVYSCIDCGTRENVCTMVASCNWPATPSSDFTKVGFVYTQFPNTPSPVDLYPNYTWENITAQYAGAFFRAEGGNASAFESGLQDDATSVTGLNTSFCTCPYTSTHTHEVRQAVQGSCVAGETSARYCSIAAPLRARCGVSSTTTTSASCGSHTHGVTFTGGVETRPINYTVRIWERTA